MQCRLHELRHKRRISVAAASKILANLVYSERTIPTELKKLLFTMASQSNGSLH